MAEVPKRKKHSFSQRFFRGCSLLDFAVLSAMPWICLAFGSIFMDTPLGSFCFLAAIFFFVTWPLMCFEGLRLALRKPGLRAFLKDEIAAYEVESQQAEEQA